MNSLNLALPRSGDFAQGGPNSSYDRGGANQTDLDTVDQPVLKNVAPGLTSHPAGSPVTAWAAFIVIGVLLKWGFDRLRKPGEQMGFIEWFVIGIFVVVAQLNFAKWVAASWYIPGVSTLVLAA
jgi:hypothetical protein